MGPSTSRTVRKWIRGIFLLLELLLEQFKIYSQSEGICHSKSLSLW